jgi:hypothetical protein
MFKHNDLFGGHVTKEQLKPVLMQPPLPPIGNPDRNHKLWNIESTERYISRHCWNVATCKWKVHTRKIEIMSFVVVFR